MKSDFSWSQELALWKAETLYQLTGLKKYYYAKKQLDKLKIHCLEERARMTRKLWLRVLYEGNWICAYCHVRNYKNQDKWKPKMEVDHIIPVSKYGKTIRSNLQALCSPCNKRKGDKIAIGLLVV